MIDWKNFLDIEEHPEKVVNIRKKHKDFCDEKVNEGHKKSGYKIISFFEKNIEQFQEIKEHDIKIPQLNVTELYCYTINNNNFIYYVNGADKDDDCYDYEYIIFETKTDFLIIGARCSHSNVITRDFTYCNSDGSSDSITVKSREFQNQETGKLDYDYKKRFIPITPKFLIECVKDYYEHCCNDEYH